MHLSLVQTRLAQCNAPHLLHPSQSMPSQDGTPLQPELKSSGNGAYSADANRPAMKTPARTPMRLCRAHTITRRMDCLLCRIVASAKEASVVYQDDRVLAGRPAEVGQSASASGGRLWVAVAPGTVIVGVQPVHVRPDDVTRCNQALASRNGGVARQLACRTWTSWSRFWVHCSRR
jgi:hypothetical protein